MQHKKSSHLDNTIVFAKCYLLRWNWWQWMIIYGCSNQEKLLSMGFLCIFRKYRTKRKISNFLEPTIQLSRPLTSLWLLSKRISCIMLQPCVWQSLQRILGVFVIHPTQKFQVVMVVAIKEMTGRKSVKIHWNLNWFSHFGFPSSSFRKNLNLIDW